MSPLELSIVLHYYGCASDFRDGDFSAPAVRGSIDDFLHERVLLNTQGDDQRTYQLGERGRVFVEHLMAQPLPVQVWQMPRGAALPEGDQR